MKVWDGVGTQECHCCGVEKGAAEYVWKYFPQYGCKVPGKTCISCRDGEHVRMLCGLANAWRGPVGEWRVRL